MTYLMTLESRKPACEESTHSRVSTGVASFCHCLADQVGTDPWKSLLLTALTLCWGWVVECRQMNASRSNMEEPKDIVKLTSEFPITHC